jgi:hypothetical protein
VEKPEKTEPKSPPDSSNGSASGSDVKVNGLGSAISSLNMIHDLNTGSDTPDLRRLVRASKRPPSRSQINSCTSGLSLKR